MESHLTKVRRLIAIYRSGGDARVGEIDVTHVPLETVSRIVQPSGADPLLYDSYKLGADQIEAFQEHAPELLSPQAGVDCYLEAEAESRGQR